MPSVLPALLRMCLALWLSVMASSATAQLAAINEMMARDAPEAPLEVAVGVEITQITGVDQKAENFGVVARIRMKWQDPALAFDPQETGRVARVMDSTAFLNEARERGLLVPAAIIENQQSRSFEKEAVVTWQSDGTALFASETILTLQAPDFDFRIFPFDHQRFFFRIVANAPTEYLRFVPLEGLNGMGDTLGEEEWIIRDVWTETDEVKGLTGLSSARFSLGFEAERHLLYYWARIFVPLILLISITWANFFLEEYRRRIDISSGNLLAFIAFNFTISGELPRLGYLTFLDAILMSAFIISAGAVAYNVMLRRLSLNGHEQKARALDWHVTIWGFPTLIVLTILVLWQVFFAA